MMRPPASTEAASGATQRDGFASALLAWHDHHGRRNLPWQHPRSAYRVWVSEVMLQQTQVRTVVPYFERFMAALPTLASLAAASEDQVLALWSGLGYYSRARNLHCAARLCMARHAGALPRDAAALASLPGIGRSTAAAILALAHGQRQAILDGNVRRVLARWHGVEGWPGTAAIERQLWHLAESHTPTTRVADYTQAIMDLGATVCTRAHPRCASCPLAAGCQALRKDRVATLPTPRPRRSVPLRATTLLMLRDTAGRVLLERRPPVGVWARLWSLPETPQRLSDDTALAAYLRDHCGVTPGPTTRLPGFTHAFTHFRLQVAPIRCDDVRPLEHIAEHPVRRWCTPADWTAAALPAPVRRLLESLEEPR